MATLESRIAPLAEAAAAMHGLVVVAARMTGGGKYQTLQVLLEQPDGTSPTLDACTAVSKQLARDMDLAEANGHALIKGRYTLEVGSPGLERPLTKPVDFQRFLGKTAKLRLKSHENLTGIITSANENDVTLTINDQPTTINLNDIHAAELAPTKAEVEAWLRAGLTRSDAGRNNQSSND